MKAFLTVLGCDRVGIIADVSSELAKHSINILDITQTILHNYFSMVMFIDLTNSDISIAQLQDSLSTLEGNLSVRVQSEDIFNSMHRI